MGKKLVIKGANFHTNAIPEEAPKIYIGLPNGMTFDSWKSAFTSSVRIPNKSYGSQVSTEYSAYGCSVKIGGTGAGSIMVVNRTTRQAEVVKAVTGAVDWIDVEFDSPVTIDSNHVLTLYTTNAYHYNDTPGYEIGNPKSYAGNYGTSSVSVTEEEGSTIAMIPYTRV